MPLSKDNVTVYAPFSKEIIQLNKLKSNLKNTLFIAGLIPQEFYELEKKNVENFDLTSSETLTILNAIPTAEGTIKIAIEETEHTIHESNVMIFGYGRIGKILCDRFQKLGANVYCVARKETDLAWIREKRYIPVKYEEIPKYCEKMNIIVNTVPTVIIDENILRKLQQNCIIIDVASKPRRG